MMLTAGRLFYVTSLIALYKAATIECKFNTRAEKDMDADFHYHIAYECVKSNFDEAAIVFLETAAYKYPEYLNNLDLNSITPGAAKSYQELAKAFPERFKK